ncbi:NRPS protein [Marasmius oreades]|uniref:NRPS protein n=1 Tax=Marasmius oreades TaxID=181124 RepID=A0A9P7RP43_9AGAR|nr:NRPS protein [Marasmius oreades]KAG7086753.1 NRPS protein [Marasmius oreades]
MSSLLDDYSFQPLPDLGTGSRHPPEGQECVELSFDTRNVTEPLLRASFSKVILLYLDSTDFVFANGVRPRVPFRSKLPGELEPSASFEAFARDLEDQVWSGSGVDEDELASKWGLKAGRDPFPVVFYWDPSSPEVSTSTPLFLRANPTTGRLFLWYSTTILSQVSADILLRQVYQTCIFVSSVEASSVAVTAPLSLPRSLMSAYEPPYDDSRTVLTLSWLSKNARERPDAIAHEVYITHGLDHPPDTITYKELNERSNKLARWLIRHKKLHVGREDRIAVCRSRDVHFYVAHAGIWKAGGCYVSIDPDLPIERKRYIATDSNALLVITTPEQASIFGDRAVVLDDPGVQSMIEEETDTSDICHAELDKLAYLLYTSGTTGTPKGCLLNHRGLYWAIEAMSVFPAKVTNADTDKRLALASIAFDVHISEITQSWRLGIRLVSGQRYELLADLKGVIKGLGITHLGMVPSMIEATLTGEEEKLKYLVSGGEKMSDSLLKKWANHPRVILANFYGPTEATVGCTSRRVSPNDRKENIGRPFESCHAYVVDPKHDLKLVPRGTPGELLVCGPLIGVGYIGLPEVTKKVFIEYEGKRGYRTGDLVRMMPDGSLEIMGRIDTQIKLRGVRIEAEGISNVLRSAVDAEVDAATMIATHPEISAASSELLVSFVAIHDSSITFQRRRTEVPPVILTDEMKVNVKKMRDKSEKELAVYMRPSYIIPLGWLPLSLNGKVESKVLKTLFREMGMKQLLEIEGSGGGLDKGVEERAATETELRIMDIIRRVTSDDKTGLHHRTNLFECGFDSLKFAALAGELRKEFAIRVDAAGVMEKPVVQDISRLVLNLDQAQERSGKDRRLVDEEMEVTAKSVFAPSDIEVVLPLFPVQGGILFRTIQDPQSYVQHFMYRCMEGVDAQRVKKSWQAVMRRQQILRTVFVSDDTGALIQVVLREGAVDIPWRLMHVQFDEDFEEWFSKEEALSVSTQVNEDLTTPLWAINMYEVDSIGAQSLYMVFSINHALYDGNAMPLLAKEFRAMYLSTSLPEPVPLSAVLSVIPPPDDSRTKQFFLDHFAALKESRISNSSRDVVGEAKAIWRTYQLEGVSLSDVKEKCSRHWHVTLQAFWTVGFAVAGRELFGWSSKEAVFGVVRSGRSLPLESVGDAICPLVTVVPTCLAFDDPNKMLREAQTFVRESSKFEHASLGQVQMWLGVRNLVEVLLSCRFDDGPKTKEVVEHIASSRSVPEFYFNIEIVMNPSADSVEARLSYMQPKLSQEAVHLFLHKFEECVESLVSEHGHGLQFSSDAATGSDGKSSDDVPQRVVNHKLEALLTRVIAEFLQVDQSTVHPTTSLTSLGLSSIRAVSLARRLSEEGLRVSAVDIIQGDIIRVIAQRAVDVSVTAVDHESGDDHRKAEEWLASLKDQLATDLDLSRVKLAEHDILTMSGCTALQTGMLSQTLNSGGKLYVHAFTCRLLPGCDVDRLRAAWEHAVHDLDILRTSFHFAPNVGLWAQVVHSVSDFKWVSRSLDSNSSISSTTSDFISSLSFKDEDALSRPPVHFLHVSKYVVVVLHHALYDGIAIPKLFRRVRQAYYHYRDNKPVPRPAVPFLPTADAILLQEKRGTRYWTSKLDGVKACVFPREVGRTRSSEDAWRASIVLNPSADDIRRFARRYHVHPQCLGQLAWAKVLARKVGSPDVVFGQVISGRTLPDADSVIGPVFNTISCRVTFVVGETNRRLIRMIHEWNTSGVAWQHASLRLIQRQLGTPKLFDTLFLYQPYSEPSADDDEIWETLERGDMQEGKTQYAINVELHEGVDTFSVFASCASDVATHEGLIALLNELSDEFTQLVKAPNAPIANNDNLANNQSAPDTPTTKVQDIEDMSSWTDKQRQLRKILVDFVGLPPEAVSPTTSLVSIGIDSICAIQVASLARRAGLVISATQVAQSNTVHDLVSVLSIPPQGGQDPRVTVTLPEAIVSRVRSSLPEELGARIEQILPASSGMIYYMSTEQAAANAFVFRTVRNQEDPGMVSRRVRDAWRDVVRKHGILRSFMRETGESEFRMVLCVLKGTSYECEWTEMRIDLTSQDEVGAVREQARALMSMSGFSIGPPTRLALLHGETSSYLILGLHHAQYDAWSLPLVMKDFESFYTGKHGTAVVGDIEPFMEVFLRDSKILDEQKSYWERVFRPGFEARLFPELNMKRRDLSISGFLGCLRQPPQEIPAYTFVNRTGLVQSLDAVQSKAKSRNLSLQSILLASWSIIQARRTLCKSATFLLCQAGRSGVVPDVDILAAPTVNYIPTLVDTKDGNIVEIAKQIQDELGRRSPVVEQSRVADIVRWVGKAGKPLTNISVNVLRLPDPAEGRSSSRVFQPVKIPYAPRIDRFGRFDKPIFPEIKHDCQVEMYFHPSTNSIGMSIECRAELLSEKQASGICRDWCRLVDEFRKS